MQKIGHIAGLDERFIRCRFVDSSEHWLLENFCFVASRHFKSQCKCEKLFPFVLVAFRFCHG